MRPTSASYLLVACLSLVELAGCGGDDSGALFSTGNGKDAGTRGSGGSTGGSGGSTTGGSSGAGGDSGEAGTAGSGEAGTSGAAGADDAGNGGAAGTEQDGSVDGTSGSGGGGAVSGTDAAPDANCPQPTTYYADADKDGFGDARSTVKACQQPAGYSTNHDDCYDGNADAKPGQTAWFAKHRGDGSYDYDCNGTGVRRWTTTGGCPLAFCTVVAGWRQTIPNCGDTGDWISSCSMSPFCQPGSEPRPQECH